MCLIFWIEAVDLQGSDQKPETHRCFLSDLDLQKHEGVSLQGRELFVCFCLPKP